MKDLGKLLLAKFLFFFITFTIIATLVITLLYVWVMKDSVQEQYSNMNVAHHNNYTKLSFVKEFTIKTNNPILLNACHLNAQDVGLAVASDGKYTSTSGDDYSEPRPGDPDYEPGDSGDGGGGGGSGGGGGGGSGGEGGGGGNPAPVDPTPWADAHFEDSDYGAQERTGSDGKKQLTIDIEGHKWTFSQQGKYSVMSGGSSRYMGDACGAFAACAIYNMMNGTQYNMKEFLDTVGANNLFSGSSTLGATAWKGWLFQTGAIESSDGVHGNTYPLSVLKDDPDGAYLVYTNGLDSNKFSYGGSHWFIVDHGTMVCARTWGENNMKLSVDQLNYLAALSSNFSNRGDQYVNSGAFCYKINTP